MISKTITAVACVSAFAMAAPAAQAKSPLPMSYAKHQAWETAQDYTETTPHDDLGYQSQKCRRINRRVVDCKTKIELKVRR